MDHSLVVDVLETHPDADDALIARMPQHVITRALGMDESAARAGADACAPSRATCTCSARTASPARSTTIASRRCSREKRTPNEHVRALIDAALAAGSRDNVAALVVECRETDVAPPRRPSVRPLEAIVRPPPAMRAPARRRRRRSSSSASRRTSSRPTAPARTCSTPSAASRACGSRAHPRSPSPSPRAAATAASPSRRARRSVRCAAPSSPRRRRSDRPRAVPPADVASPASSSGAPPERARSSCFTLSTLNFAARCDICAMTLAADGRSPLIQRSGLMRATTNERRYGLVRPLLLQPRDRRGDLLLELEHGVGERLVLARARRRASRRRSARSAAARGGTRRPRSAAASRSRRRASPAPGPRGRTRSSTRARAPSSSSRPR